MQENNANKISGNVKYNTVQWLQILRLNRDSLKPYKIWNLDKKPAALCSTTAPANKEILNFRKAALSARVIKINRRYFIDVTMIYNRNTEC